MVNLVTEAETISDNMIHQKDRGLMSVVPTDQLKHKASETAKVVRNARPAPGKNGLKYRCSEN